MALKRFNPALSDCQQAAVLQSADPQPKTLVRLARCQLSTGSTAPALSTLRSVLAIDSKNATALQLQKRVLELEAHLRNLEGARGRNDWGMARLALDKCIQVIEGEGGDVPIQWRLWRVEIEIAKKNWDAASLAAKCVPYRSFERLSMSMVFKHICPSLAMQCGSTLIRQTSWPCAVSSCS